MPNCDFGRLVGSEETVARDPMSFNVICRVYDEGFQIEMYRF